MLDFLHESSFSYPYKPSPQISEFHLKLYALQSQNQPQNLATAYLLSFELLIAFIVFFCYFAIMHQFHGKKSMII